MKIKPNPLLATLLLWLVAGGATLWMVGESARLTHVAPLWAICLIGNLTAIRRSELSR